MKILKEENQILYIHSMKYSGSTLLGFLLGHHPQVFTIGERRKFYQKTHDFNKANIICSCGENFRRCPEWMGAYNQLSQELEKSDWSKDFSLRILSKFRRVNKVLHRINLLLFSLKALFLIRILPWNARNIRLNHKLVNHFLAKHDKRFFLDTSKFNPDIPLFAASSNRLKIVYIFKNPYAQIFSRAKHNPGISLSILVNDYVKEIGIHSDLLKSLGSDAMLVSYDELSTNPGKVLQEIMKFWSLDSSIDIVYAASLG